jgi:hypothetical protein
LALSFCAVPAEYGLLHTFRFIIDESSYYS